MYICNINHFISHMIVWKEYFIYQFFQYIEKINREKIIINFKINNFVFLERNTCLVDGESSLLPLLASALRASRGPMSVRAMADSFLWRSWEVTEAADGAAVDGWTSVSDSSSVSDSVSSEELLVSSSSSSSSSFFFAAGSSRGVWIGGGGAARLPANKTISMLIIISAFFS